MAGRGDAELLPPDLIQVQDSVYFHFICSFARDNAPPLRSDNWTHLSRCRKHPSTRGPHFGPELSFGKLVSEHFGEPIGIIKVAFGGTNLAEDWNPAAHEGKELFSQLLSAIQLGENRLVERHLDAQLAAILWLQGESDSGSVEFSQSYKQNLRRFVDELRERLVAPSIPFIIGQIVDRGHVATRYANTVREAQLAVARETRMTQLVPTDDLTDTGDLLHFDAPALVTLGKRFASAYFDLTAT